MNKQKNAHRRPKIVVVGAGFAGLKAVKCLSGVEAEVLLLDCHNYHTFVPLLYQVATGFIKPELIAYPLRTALRKYSNAKFLMAEVKEIDPESKTVFIDGQTIVYDYLVIATGSQTNFLEVSGAPQYTLPLRTLDHAVTLRNHIIHCFEQATKLTQEDITRQKQLMTFVIVGGGPTGVEMAGALQELIDDCLVRDYTQLKMYQPKVILLHSGESLLGVYPQRLRKYTLHQLRARGIKVHLHSRVNAATPTAVHLEDGSTIATSTIIWTAGVEANIPPSATNTISAHKKMEVLTTLQLPEYPQVYGVGDSAYVEQNGKPLLGIAPEALQQGKAVAENIKRQLKGETPKAFEYFNKGTAAIIARNAGVILLFGKIPLGGFLAWLLWLSIHLYYLPGFSQRRKVLVAWLEDYFLRARAFMPIIF